MTNILGTVHNLSLKKTKRISEKGSVTIFRWKVEKENLCWWSLSKQTF